MELKKMDIDPEVLVDIGLQIGLVPDAKYHYRWNELANWQFDAMKKVGLEKDKSILDIGCGALRFGSLAINFLNSGNYCGMDAIKEFLEMGKLILAHLDIKNEYSIIHSNKFEFKKFNRKFDFAIAQSVFTHLTKDQIFQCISNLKEVMNEGGVFLFTYTKKSKPYGLLYNYFEPVIAGKGIDDNFINHIESKFNIKYSIPSVKHPYQNVGVFTF